MIMLMLLGITTAKAQFARSPYVTRDPRLDKLVDKQAELNKEALKARTVLEPGFRILVISTNKRDLALDTKTKLMKLYPDQKNLFVLSVAQLQIAIRQFQNP